MDSSAAEVRTVLTTAGVPSDAQPAVVAGIRDCLRDRTAEDDPDVVPASCQGATEPAPEVQAYAQEQVRAGFQDATLRTTGVTLILLILAFGLSFLLPKKARPETEG